MTVTITRDEDWQHMPDGTPVRVGILTHMCVCDRPGCGRWVQAVTLDGNAAPGEEGTVLCVDGDPTPPGMGVRRFGPDGLAGWLVGMCGWGWDGQGNLLCAQHAHMCGGRGTA